MGTQLIVRVRERRRSRGLSQQQLAERAGISRQTLVAIEAGRLVPSVAIALRLAQVLGCRVDDLFALPTSEYIEAVLAVPEQVIPEPPFRVRLARVGEDLVAWPALEETGEAEGIARERRGDRVLAEPSIDPELLERGLVLVGCDPALGILAAYLRRWHRDLRVSWVPCSSLTALRTLSRGRAHLAGTHLWDPESGDYNLPVIRRELAGKPVLVVTLARWVEGLAIRVGNPKAIRSLADLARPDVTVVNREPGSGSRVVLDTFLAREGIAPGMVRGYEREVTGHRAIAETVASGLADAGPLVYPVARSYGLDFVPLLEERYDLVIPFEFADWPPVRDLLELLTSRSVQRELEVSGYALQESGRLVARVGH